MQEYCNGGNVAKAIKSQFVSTEHAPPAAHPFRSPGRWLPLCSTFTASRSSMVRPFSMDVCMHVDRQDIGRVCMDIDNSRGYPGNKMRCPCNSQAHTGLVPWCCRWSMPHRSTPESAFTCRPSQLAKERDGDRCAPSQHLGLAGQARVEAAGSYAWYNTSVRHIHAARPSPPRLCQIGVQSCSMSLHAAINLCFNSVP
jgi:hypothetical protein